MAEKPRFEISSIDLQVLLSEVNAALPRYVSQIYRGTDNSYILRLTGREDVRDLKMAPGRVIFLASGVYQSHGQLDEVAALLRKSLKGSVLRSAEQVVGERIARLHFERRGLKLDLIVEVFPGGGLSLIDEGGVVILSTSLKKGQSYEPPTRRATVSTRDEVLALLSMVEGRLKVGVALAKEMGLGTKYSNELVARAHVDSSKKVSELDFDSRERLAGSLESLYQLLLTPEPTVYRVGGEYVAFAPFPLIQMESQGLEAMRVSSLNEAVNLVYESFVRAAKTSEHRRRLDEEAKRIEREIEGKRKLAEELKAKAVELRELAQLLHTKIGELKGSWDELKSGGSVEGLVKSVDRASGTATLLLGGREVQLSLKRPVTHQINELFNSAKTTMKGVENLLKEVEELEKRLSKLREEAPAKQQMEVVVVRRRETEWFRRYRWSMTSSERLIVMGRDASSNVRLLKNHLESMDLVFHAEVRGSPVALLKNGQGAGDVELRETATLCASFSRAWREGLSSVSVYWVKPDQISFTPPQGTYLPKGSFLVKPPKNYIQAMLEISVGYSQKLGPIVGCETWVKKEAVLYAVIAPGQEDASTVSKNLVAKLSELPNISSSELKISDFEKLIPYGRCRVLRWSR
ncbi:MAG: NFACT family protein [Nitrososphaerota archaeon]|nr:NFACT family protein [Candidatus Calditenuaceae archaeon]MDW8072869.1 NFACT family protein [Nitrososphaerota archaeon]